MPNLRAKVTALVVSAAGLASFITYEGLKEMAYIPVKGDKVTIGVGSTQYENGAPIQMGDTVTKERAVILFKNTLGIYELAVKKCVTVPLYPYEFDAYVSLTYNIGGTRFCKGLIPVKLTAFDYAGACKEILRYNQFQGRVLRGLEIRRQDEYKTCIGAKEKDYALKMLVNNAEKLNAGSLPTTKIEEKGSK